MTIEEIIKEAFSKGWNASHECATGFDYDCALSEFLSDVENEVKKIRIGAVSDTFSQKDMENFAAKCMILGHGGKTTEELLKDFCDNDR